MPSQSTASVSTIVADPREAPVPEMSPLGGYAYGKPIIHLLLGHPLAPDPLPSELPYVRAFLFWAGPYI